MAPDGSHADSTVGGDEHPRRFNVVRAIVFDLDGTLNDWETSISLALEQITDEGWSIVDTGGSTLILSLRGRWLSRTLIPLWLPLSTRTFSLSPNANAV